MPITEGPGVDGRTQAVIDLFTYMKDDPGIYEEVHAKRAEAHEREVIERAAKAERSARMSGVAKARKGAREPGSRPFQAAGYRTRALWEAAGSPEPEIRPSKRELIEARLRSRGRKG